MSGVLIIFMLLFIYKILDYQNNIESKEAMIESLSSTRTQIIAMLQEEFEKENIDILIDPKTGAIRLSEAILFDYGKNELKEEGKSFLQKFIPIYVRILFSDDEIKQALEEIEDWRPLLTKRVYAFSTIKNWILKNRDRA